MKTSEEKKVAHVGIPKPVTQQATGGNNQPEPRTAHSPLPWSVHEHGIMAADGLVIDDTLMPPADADFICRAVNAHDELVAVVTRVRDAISSQAVAGGNHRLLRQIADEFDALLSKVKP